MTWAIQMDMVNTASDTEDPSNQSDDEGGFDGAGTDVCDEPDHGMSQDAKQERQLDPSRDLCPLA